MMKIDDFVQQHGLHGSLDDFYRCLDSFRQEIAAGLSGQPSSLKMLPAYIDADAEHDFSHPVIALDAGGTTLRCAQVVLDAEAKPAIHKRELLPLPGTMGELGIEQFYDQLAAAVAGVGAADSRIGVAFSFPCAIQPDREGRILSFVKEVQVRGAENSLIGQGLTAALQRAGEPCPQRVTVLNDTTAVLLAAKAYSRAQCSSYIGFVLGSGMNACYIEQNSNISKDLGLRRQPGTCIVNLEAAGFNKMPRSAIDLEFDASTANPGQQTLEKLVSGAYLAPLLRLYIIRAAEAGCFSPEVCTRVAVLDKLQPIHITTFGSGTTPLDEFVCNYALDRAALCVLLDAFLERAAMLISALLSSLLLQSGAGHDSLHPVCISCDGSTFALCSPLREKVLRKMRDFAADELDLHARFVELDDATLVGAALAASLY